MVTFKCGNCGLANFSIVAPCRRCGGKVNPVESAPYTLNQLASDPLSVQAKIRKPLSLARVIGLLFILFGLLALAFGIYGWVVTLHPYAGAEMFVVGLAFLISGGLLYQGQKVGLFFYVATVLAMFARAQSANEMDKDITIPSLAIHAVVTLVLLIEWRRGNLS